MTETAVLTRPAHGFAALERNGPVVPFEFARRTLRDHDVALDVLYCGICHTDLHMIGPWGQEYPMMPGHEIVGRVTEVGAHVTNFVAGQMVAVSVIVDSCRDCRPCEAHDETYCEVGPT